MHEKEENYDKEEDVFIKNIVDTVREQMLEYILWKISRYNTFEEFKEKIKKELTLLHSKNMKKIETEINDSP